MVTIAPTPNDRYPIGGMNENRVKPNGEYQILKGTKQESIRRQTSSLTRSSDNSQSHEKTHILSRQSNNQIGNEGHFQNKEYVQDQGQGGLEQTSFQSQRRWTKHQSPGPDMPALSREQKGEKTHSSSQAQYKTKYMVKKRDEASPGANSVLLQRPQHLRAKEESPAPQQPEQAGLDTEWPSLGGGQQQPSANSRTSRPTRGTTAVGVAAAAATSGASSSPSRPVRLRAPALPQSPLRLVTPSGHFADEAVEYLEPGNTNFAVVGVLGLQASGKSSLLNALLTNQLPGDELASGDAGCEFGVETLENVVENSHCTRGIQLQVTPERALLLDSEALLALPSAEPLIQAAASERRGASAGAAATGASASSGGGGQSDFITVETGATMHGIQLSAFLMSVCHLLLVVQDGWPDPDLLRLLLTADMLRPAVLDGTEFQPRLVFVLNRSGGGPAPDQLRDLLAGVFESAAFRLDSDDVFCLPLLDGSEDATVEYTEELERLRKLILTAPRHHMLRQDLFNEKVWLEFAAQVWDDVQKSVMLAEYHRLIG